MISRALSAENAIDRCGIELRDFFESQRRLNMPEVAEQGWDALGKMFGLSGRRMRDRRVELSRNGVIFYMRKGPRTIMHFFPSTVRAYVMMKAQEGNKI